MATQPFTNKGDQLMVGALITWNVMANGDSGAATPAGLWSGSYFQATGTFGAGGSVQIEGSNDGSTWVKLSPTALVAAGYFAALGAGERPAYVRPHVTAGDGTTAIVVSGYFR
jgi:hypothetical protein